MGVTFIAPQGTYTAPAKLVTKEITENGTYDATDDSANGYSSVTVNVEGGGGSSDFSTAQMTINASESFELTWGSCPMLLDGALHGSLYVESLPATITVPLYNGKCVWDHTTRDLTLSGNIEELYEGEAMLITGDCTITIS